MPECSHLQAEASVAGFQGLHIVFLACVEEPCHHEGCGIASASRVHHPGGQRCKDLFLYGNGILSLSLPGYRPMLPQSDRGLLRLPCVN